jgi:hypothetical protein
MILKDSRNLVFKRAFSFLVLITVGACIDRIDIPAPTTLPADLVVDGLITDAPGPYTVKLTRGIHLDDTQFDGDPLHARSVTLYDNFGNSEVMQETKTGVYRTKPDGMQGIVGREYFIRIETTDGHLYQSIPDKMNPVGDFDTLYYEFEEKKDRDGFDQQGFRIFVDAAVPEGDSTFTRWRFTGTYVVETLPQYKAKNADPGKGCVYGPLPCSGWANVNGELKEGYAYNPVTYKYEYVVGLKCTCCRCWITPREHDPVVKSGYTQKNGTFNRLEVGYVPVNFYTFYEKYQVKVSQMSISRRTYDFWMNLSQQRQAINSLFQPVTGKVQTNFTENGNPTTVQGIFQASAIKTKILYLDKDTHKVTITVPKDCAIPPREGPMGESCLLAFPGSIATLERPADWED